MVNAGIYLESIRRHLALLFLFAGLPAVASADDLIVTVLDRDGAPISGVAVFLDVAGKGGGLQTGKTAIMDQVDTRFVPHVLIVETGTEVQFPNSDSVAHHVYSFSDPNDFKLPLYKGDSHPPVSFMHPGIVTLGCNIHDNMLAYILVVDTDVFGKTDETGVARLSVDSVRGAGISIWSPRVKDNGGLLTQTFPDDLPKEFTFRLTQKLRPPHDSDSTGIQWSDY